MGQFWILTCHQKLTVARIPRVLVEAREQLKNKTGDKSLGGFFGWLLAQHLRSDTKAALEVALRDANISPVPPRRQTSED